MWGKLAPALWAGREEEVLHHGKNRELTATEAVLYGRNQQQLQFRDFVPTERIRELNLEEIKKFGKKITR